MRVIAYLSWRYRKWRRLTPVRPQFQATECGIGALQSIMAHCGCHVSAETLRQVTGISRHCLNGREMLACARHFGLEAKAFKRTPAELATTRLPAIVHVRFIHFMVLEVFSSSEVRLNDPLSGRVMMSRAAFDEIFTGIVMEFGAGRDIPGTPVIDPLSRLKRHWGLGGVPAAAALIGCVVVQWPFAEALYAGRLPLWPAVAMGICGCLAVGLCDAAAAFTAAEAATVLMRHVGRLDAGFFAYRFSDRLRGTIVSARDVAKKIHRAVVPGAALLLSAATLAILLAVRTPWPGCAVLTLLLVHGTLVAMLRGWPSGVYRLAPGFADTAVASLSPSLYLAAPLKFGRNGENHRQTWLGAIATAWHRGLRSRRRHMMIDLAAPGLTACAFATIAFLGRPSAGAIFLVFAITDAWRRGISALLAAHGLDTLLWHMADIMRVAPVNPTPTAMTGAIITAPVLELRAVTFGYARSRRPVLRDVSFTLPPGAQLGLSGPSGQGKSSLAAIAAGLHTPWSGAVLLDGQPLAAVSAACRSHSIALIDRRTAIFAGTLRDNMTLWSKAIADCALIRALDAACLWSEIAERGGLDLRLEADGVNLSLGQAQRLEIARALALEPRVLILDECLDALDLALERQIRTQCRERGVALLIVSHRRETMAACDAVIRLTSEDAATPLSVGLSTTDRSVASDASGDAAQKGAERAIHRIATVLGAPSIPCSDRDDEGVPALAARHGLVARRARVVDATEWRDGLGPALTTRTADGCPVVLFRIRDHYHIWEGDGPPARVEAGGLPGLISPDIWTFQRMPDLAAGPISTILTAGWRETAAASGSAALRASVCLLPAIVLTTGRGRAALVLGLLALIPLILGEVRARLRGEIQRDTTLTAWLLGRLARLQVRFAIELPFATRDAAQAGLSRMLAAAHDLPQAIIYDGVTLLGCTAFLLVQHLYPALPVLGVFLAGLCGPPVLAWQAAPVRRSHRDALLAEVLLLDAMLAAWARLHMLKAWPRMAARWQATRPHGTTPARMLLLRAWPLMTGAAPLGTLAINAVPPSAGVMAFICLGLSGALGIGGTLARLTRLRSDSAAVARVADGSSELGQSSPGPAARKITLERAGFRYPGQDAWALRDISLTLRPGRIVAITGASGSGKTTLLNIILGLDRPESGIVWAGNEALQRLDMQAWRQGIGAVLQRSRLDRAGTIRGQVAGPTNTSDAAIWEALRLAEVADEVAARPMGLRSIVEYSGLSGGEEQRILIAQALLKRPWLLVLDEATSAIPDARQAALLATLRRLGIGCLLSTHRPSAIALADEVFCMVAGSIGTAAPTKELQGRSQ